MLEESPCADHCIRFALSSDDVQYKTACDHEHTMQCDRCLDCANVAHDIIAGLDSGDISLGKKYSCILLVICQIKARTISINSLSILPCTHLAW